MTVLQKDKSNLPDSEIENDSEPQPNLQNAAYKMEIMNTKKQYELLNIH